MEEERGVTLVGIVIGVIVIAMLVGVSLFMLADGGLIDQVNQENENKNQAVVSNEVATYKEDINKVLDTLFVMSNDDEITEESINKVIQDNNLEKETLDVIDNADKYVGNILYMNVKKDTDGKIVDVEVGANANTNAVGTLKINSENGKEIQKIN